MPSDKIRPQMTIYVDQWDTLRAEVERLREASTDGYTVTFIPPPPAGETSDDR